MADIILRRSLTPGNNPTTGSLGIAQIAVNVPDGKAFLRRSGSQGDRINEILTTNTSNSGSFHLSGSIFMWQSASTSGTNIFGTASFSDTASYVESRINREWHVSSGSGNDTTGDGSILRPFKTLARASSSLGNTGERIVLHTGTYPENVTFPQLNFTITTVGTATPGDVFVNGTLTFTGASSSNKLSGFTITSLVQSGNANLYLDTMTITGTTTKSGTGYFETQNSGISQVSTVTISNSGTCVFQGGKIGSILQSNASAVVSILDCMTAVFPRVNAGTMLVKDSIVYSVASGSAALSGSATSIVFLQNSSFYNPNGTAERVIINGLYSYDDIIFNREVSVTGSSLVSRAHFDHLQANSLSGSLFGTSSWAERGGTVVTITGSAPLTSSLTASLVGTTWFDTQDSKLYVKVSGSTGKSFWSGSGGGGTATVTVARTPPTGSATGSLFWDTDDGNLYIQTQTPSGTVWVPAVNTLFADVNTGSFTGSFTGDFTGSFNGSASYSLTASYAMNAGGTGITNTGSFTGSFTGSLEGSSSYALTASYALNAGGGGGGSTYKKVSGWPGYATPLASLGGVLFRLDINGVPQVALTGSTDTLVGSGWISKIGAITSPTSHTNTAMSTSYINLHSTFINQTGGVLEMIFKLNTAGTMFRVTVVDGISSTTPLLSLEQLN